MAELRWLDSGAHGARDFSVDGASRAVTGALWGGENMKPDSPMVLCGHGASGDRYQAPIPHLARRFVQADIAVLAIDGPVHGLRQVGPGGREAFFEEMKRAECVDDMVSDWHTGISGVQQNTDLVQGPIGYFGLSMGTMFGVPLLASLAGAGAGDVRAAVIGLCGTTGAAPGPIGVRLEQNASQIECPLMFLMQLQDELFPRDGYLQLFDALAAEDKRLHANPGLHPEVPAEEVDFAFEFLRARLQGSVERRIINPLAE